MQKDASSSLRGTWHSRPCQWLFFLSFVLPRLQPPHLLSRELYGSRYYDAPSLSPLQFLLKLQIALITFSALRLAYRNVIAIRVCSNLYQSRSVCKTSDSEEIYAYVAFCSVRVLCRGVTDRYQCRFSETINNCSICKATIQGIMNGLTHMRAN